MTRALLVILGLFADSVLAGEPITTGTLLHEMHDLGRLTRMPDPAHRVVQFSSYDRRSDLPGGPNWFANSDGFGGEPIPGFESVAKAPGADGIGEYVICDVKQPGAIVRSWSAAIEGSLRMELDGRVVYDGPAADWMMRRSEWAARESGRDPAASGDAFHQRFADYLPMPFGEGCRLVWVGDLKRVHFYQVQVRLYEAGTAIRTFTPQDLRTFGDEAEQAIRALVGTAAAPDMPGSAHTAAPSESRELLKLAGPAAITSLRVRVEAPDVQDALRTTVVRVHFDGAPVAQVLSPIGDFFGVAPGAVTYRTLPFSVEPDGSMTCRLAMPFEREAAVFVDNRGGQPVAVRVATETAPYAWDDRSMHLHARWRVDHDLLARPGAGAADLPFVVARGKGLYVGTSVYLLNPCPIPTAGGNWWGEGDEKIFVDDEPRPSIFGTGSEDYFNYAWSQSDIFEYPYFSQPICTGPETRGYITNNRWHILDAIPFERSLAFYMELYSHVPTPHLSYARMSYFYARPGLTDDSTPIQDADLRVPALPAWRPVAAGGARNAVFFEAEDAIGAGPANTMVAAARFSAGKGVRFGEGAASPMTVRAEKPGRYDVVITCLSGPGATGFCALLNGQSLRRNGSERIDLHTPSHERLVNVRFDPVELAAGEHTLTLASIEGEAVVDFVWIRPVD